MGDDNLSQLIRYEMEREGFKKLWNILEKVAPSKKEKIKGRMYCCNISLLNGHYVFIFQHNDRTTHVNIPQEANKEVIPLEEAKMEAVTNFMEDINEEIEED